MYGVLSVTQITHGDGAIFYGHYDQLKPLMYRAERHNREVVYNLISTHKTSNAAHDAAYKEAEKNLKLSVLESVQVADARDVLAIRLAENVLWGRQ